MAQQRLIEMRQTQEDVGIRSRHPLGFVLGSTTHGAMIFSWRDRCESGLGVGGVILEDGEYDGDLIVIMLGMLKLLKQTRGEGVVALDVGANIGVHAVEMGRYMHGWGVVHAFEPQRYVYYALCGNIVLSNCFNIDAQPFAVGARDGTVMVKKVDHTKDAGLSGMSLNGNPEPKDADPGQFYPVRCRSIDAFDLPRVDFVKIDTEGYEIEVITGALKTLERCKPVILVEWIWVGKEKMKELLQKAGYTAYYCGINFLCFPSGDPILGMIKFEGVAEGSKIATEMIIHDDDIGGCEPAPRTEKGAEYAKSGFF